MRKCASWERWKIMVLNHVLVSFQGITVFSVTPYLHFAQSGHSHFTAELTATLKTLTTRSHSSCAAPGSKRSNQRMHWSKRHEITGKWSDWQTCALTEWENWTDDLWSYLLNWYSGVWIPAKARDFFPSPKCPDQFWRPPSLLFNGTRGYFPG